MKKYIRKNRLFFLSLMAVIAGIAAYIKGVPFLNLMELKSIDLRFQSRGEISPHNNIVLAVIDEKSIAKEGKWIWPRSKLALLVNKLSDAGAKIIAFDIGFLEPDESNQVLNNIIENVKKELQKTEIQDLSLEKYLESLKLHNDNDRLLADAIKNAESKAKSNGESKPESKVVLGYFFHTDSEMPTDTDKEEIRIREDNIRKSAYKAVRYPPEGIPEKMFNEAILPQPNIKIISDSAEYSGFFNMFPDDDGVVRWIPAVIKFRNMLYAPLGFMVVSAFLDTPLSLHIAEHGVVSLKIGKMNVPVDESGRFYINYRGIPKRFPHISITDILNKNVDTKMLKDKIVIVGATATGIYDMRVTPFGSVFPGSEIHANVVDTILSEDFLYQPEWVILIDITAIILAGLLLGIVLPQTGAIFGATAVFSLFTGYILLSQHLFVTYGLIINLVYPLLVVIIVYISITGYKYLTESSQKKFIRDAFSTYLAPSVVKQLIESPEKLVLGGEDRVITAFFSDVQGFTSISEKLSPRELVELLNEFLTEMTDIILKYEGTVDKFEGDAIIAFFGVPNLLDSQAESACKACIDMQKRLAELREVWKIQKRPELKMRIGLCTGAAVVGNMGSKSRMDYTMMGDTVNTAARLEGVNKVYGTYTLISETTYAGAASEDIRVRELDSIHVVGKKEAIRIYQLIGYSHETDKKRLEMIEHYTTGLYAYRSRDWEKAIWFFNAALEIEPDDTPAKTMLERCNEYKENPPPEDWKGIFTMNTK